MDNNQWNYNNQQSNQWNGNQQANQWNGNQGYQQGYQQGYGNQAPLGQQVDLQEQYNQQQAYGAPVPQKKKGPGCLIFVIIGILVVALGVFSVTKLIGGKDKDNKEEVTQEIEVIEDEPSLEIEDEQNAEVADTPVNPDEIVQNKIPTTDELEELWESLGFSAYGDVYINEDGASAQYTTYETEMAAEIAYESVIETKLDEMKNQHTSEEAHRSWTILSDDVDFGNYRLFQIKSEYHNKDCKISKDEFVVWHYILYGNSVMYYEYDITYDNKTSADAKTLIKSLEMINYPLAEMYESHVEEAEPEAISLDAFRDKLNGYGITAKYSSTFDDSVTYNKFDNKGLELEYFIYESIKAANSNIDAYKETALVKNFEHGDDNSHYEAELIRDEINGETRVVEVEYKEVAEDGTETGEIVGRKYVAYRNSVIVYTYKLDENKVASTELNVLEKVLTELGYELYTVTVAEP